MLDVRELVPQDYKPEENTALYDAIGDCINRYNNDQAVCLVIVTDGEENNSKKFTKPIITSMIGDKQKSGWLIMYLSADLNTASQGAAMGLYSSPTSVPYTESNNIAVGYDCLAQGIVRQCSQAVCQIRLSGKMSGMGAGDSGDIRATSAPVTYN